MTPLSWMKKNGVTQVALAVEFEITQQALSLKLSGKRPWRPAEALVWEKISSGEVARDDVLFPELRRASGD